jgi:quercetin dioxygenase-like cupin family protein
MPVFHPDEAVVHEMHGTRFVSYAAPSRGSAELCTWQVQIPPGSESVPHRISRAELFHVLSGDLRVSIDGVSGVAAEGDVIVAPAGSMLRIDNTGGELATAWVTTSAGLGAVLPDGQWLTPPWTR